MSMMYDIKNVFLDIQKEENLTNDVTANYFLRVLYALEWDISDKEPKNPNNWESHDMKEAKKYLYG